MSLSHNTTKHFMGTKFPLIEYQMDIALEHLGLATVSCDNLMIGHFSN